MDDSRYFGQGDKVELPTSLEGLRSFLEKRLDCKDANGVIIFTVESLNSKNWELTTWFLVSPSSRSASWVQGHARGPTARSAVP